MSFRDAEQSLRDRLETVDRLLAETKARAEALAEIEATRARLEAERKSVEERLERTRRRTLPLLDRIEIASPCDADWDAMEGTRQKRFCSLCEKHVYDLSAMPREEAERFVEESASACVRLHKRADGTVITDDCPVGRRRKTARTAISFLGATMLAVSSLVALQVVTADEPHANASCALPTMPRPTIAEPPREPMRPMGVAVGSMRTAGRMVRPDIKMGR